MIRAVLLTNGHSNQRALACKLSQVVDLVGIVISENVPKRKKPVREEAELLVRRGEGRLFGKPFVDAWFEMLGRYDDLYPRLPCTRVIRVRNVNDPAVIALLDAYSPDVVLVSGTNLVGKAIIERGNRRLGVLNLHTGISPYVKGGPNCTNWCLAERWFHLIGSTMMWLDVGIDTGDLICTERTTLDGRETLAELHLKVMNHGHDMYVRTVRALASKVVLPRVKQRLIAEGATFYTREWSSRPILRARRNFRNHYRQAFERGEANARAATLQLVSLPTTVPN